MAQEKSTATVAVNSLGRAVKSVVIQQNKLRKQGPHPEPQKSFYKELQARKF